MLFNHEMLNLLCIFKNISFGIKHVLFTVTNTFSSLKIGQQTTKCYNNVSQYVNFGSTSIVIGCRRSFVLSLSDDKDHHTTIKVKSSMARSLPVENLLPQNVGSIINYLQ